LTAKKDRKIAKKLKSTSGILLKGVRFCGKTTTALHEAADNLQKLLTRLTPEKAAQCASLNVLIAGVSSYTRADNINVVSLGHLFV